MDQRLPLLIERLVLSQREIHAIQEQTSRGRRVMVEQPSKGIIVGNNGGSTFNGLVNYVAALVRKYSRHHGVPLELYQIALDPSVAEVANGGNHTIAEANAAATMRQSLACVQHPDRIRFPTFAGPLTLDAPL